MTTKTVKRKTDEFQLLHDLLTTCDWFQKIQQAIFKSLIGDIWSPGHSLPVFALEQWWWWWRKVPSCCSTSLPKTTAVNSAQILPLSCSHRATLPPAGDWGQPQQHAVPGRVRPLLWPLVPGVGHGPPDPADPPPREGRHLPLAAHWLGVQIPAGHIPTAQQEGGLRDQRRRRSQTVPMF